jgi:hypothetical protein
MSTPSWRNWRPVTPASKHIGTIRMTAKGRLQLILRGQGQEHEHDGGDEHQQAVGAGQLLLEGELGPLIAEPVGRRSAASFSIAPGSGRWRSRAACCPGSPRAGNRL